MSPSFFIFPAFNPWISVSIKTKHGAYVLRTIATLARGSVDLSRLTEDGAVGSAPNGIMMVGSPDRVNSSPEGSPHDPRSTSRLPHGDAGPAVAQPGRSGEDKGAGGNSSKDLEKCNTKAPLLITREQRPYINDDVEGEDIVQASLPQQLRPGNSATGSASPFLWGRGGLLSPWRVQLLLLLVFVVTVSTQGCL